METGECGGWAVKERGDDDEPIVVELHGTFSIFKTITCKLNISE